jgi:periplasmic divalent cation tolerance protein
MPGINGAKSQMVAACIVFVTCASRTEAEVLAETLVTERLAACVNVIGTDSGPIRSFYVWEGALQRESEVLLLIKTTPARLESLETRVLELHSYTTPEFLAIPVLSGSAAYLDWLAQSVEPKREEAG